MGELQLLMYFSILLFIVVVAVKMARIAKMPIHIRWDLYPIPHEKGKGEYGGSYFEELDWWTKPREVSLISELKEMGMEIIFIQSLFKNNRPLWFFSFPFHMGMYCLCGFLAMLVVGAVMQIAGMEIAASAGGLGMIVHWLTIVFGTAGWVLSIFGSTGLLFSRLFNPTLRKTTVLSDVTNLLSLLIVAIAGIVAFTTVDPNYAYIRGFFQSVISVSAADAMPTAVAVQLWAFAVLLLYFPFTQMTHMFGKYFTYHKIRWEDTPNVRGGEIEKSVMDALGYKLNWSAPHIKSGGTWAEAATQEPTKDE